MSETYEHEQDGREDVQVGPGDVVTVRGVSEDVQTRAHAEEGPVEAPGEPVDEVEELEWPEAAAQPGDG
jgi:hypothetical protein